MLSKNQTKLITSLGKKKYRNQNGLFVVEGLKSIQEFLASSFKLVELFTVDDAIFSVDAKKINIITQTELNKISFLSTPNTALALFKTEEPKNINVGNLIVALDGINDPGNLGTIIRLCDWFGVKDLVCSHNTVDCYNPKVVQASMGSLTRVNVTYLDLPEFLSHQKTIYGTFMEGKNIYTSNVRQNGVLVFGNEANGIHTDVEKLVTQKLAIPQFGSIKETESLNVATATAIFLSEFKRRPIET